MDKSYVAFDECGYTGEHLLDPEQLVFTLGSTSICDADAEKLLSRFSGRTQGEYKYTKLKKAKRNQPLILELLNEDLISSNTCKAYVIHKPYMVTTKVVDNLIEPLYREQKVDLYEQRAAQALANLITTTFPALLGKDLFSSFLNSFSSFYRSQSKPDYDRFMKTAQSVYHHLEMNHQFAVDTFLPVIVAGERGIAYLIKNFTNNDHNPVIPAFYILSNAWSATLNKRYVALADDSKILAAERERILKFANPNIKPETAHVYDLRFDFPLKIDDLECRNSNACFSIQLADFIAGVVCHVMNRKATQGRLGDFESKLMALLLEKHLIIGGMWPSTDITPEELGATGPYSGNPAEIAARIIQ